MAADGAAMRKRLEALARRSAGNDAGRYAPEVEIEGFHSFEPIGTGGFSKVYRARQDGFDRDVALKVLSIGLETPAQQRAFERECRAMGLVSQHPNIVTVFNAAFTKDQRPCIVMEFYAGGTLGERVKQSGPLTIEQGLSLGVQMAGALETAHTNGVIHRDIKPNNLFVSDYGQPALGDFGISSFADDRTITGGGGGLTVHYAPPELIEGDNASAASDVYSLAATLFTLLAGRRPFPRATSQSVGELARRILIEPPPRLNVDGTPPALADLLQQAMAKSPGERPQSAAEFGRLLQSVQTESGLVRTAMSLAGDLATAAEPVVTPGPESNARSTAPPTGHPTSTQAPAPPAPSPLVDADDDSHGTATIARPRATATIDPALEEPIVEAGPTISRRVRGVALAVAAIVTIGLVALVATGGDDTTGEPEVTTTVTFDDADFFGAPSTPVDVTFNPTTDPLEFEVTWGGLTDDATYQVERVGDGAGSGTLDSGSTDGAAELDRVMEVANPPARIIVDTIDEQLCVVVRAVGANSLLSQDSVVACLDR